MADEPEKKNSFFGMDVSHLITGGSAAGVAVAGSFTLTQYKVDQLDKEIAGLQPMLVQQTRVTERQDTVIKGMQDLRARMDQFEKVQVELVQVTDTAKVNTARLDSVERRLDRDERRLDRDRGQQGGPQGGQPK